MLTRRTFALGLGTVGLWPVRAYAEDAEPPVVNGEITVRARAERLDVSLYLTAPSGADIATVHIGNPVDMVRPHLHWGDDREAALLLDGADGPRRDLRGGPSTWVTLAAGVRTPMDTVSFAWPKTLSPDTPCRLVAHGQVVTRVGRRALVIPDVSLVAHEKATVSS